LDLAEEAASAVQHFGVSDLANAQLIVATPPMYNDAGSKPGLVLRLARLHDSGFLSRCHTRYDVHQHAIRANAGGGCGKDFVNPAPAGDKDGVTIVLGHEIAETLIDPGAESLAGQVQYGGWFDYQGCNRTPRSSVEQRRERRIPPLQIRCWIRLSRQVDGCAEANAVELRLSLEICSVSQRLPRAAGCSVRAGMV
jgi:hypothetical protein